MTAESVVNADVISSSLLGCCSCDLPAALVSREYIFLIAIGAIKANAQTKGWNQLTLNNARNAREMIK